MYIQSGSPRNGHHSLAIDVGGYERLNRTDWYNACRRFGFEPGFFSWEPWHIIDWSPDFKPLGGSGSSATTQEEDDMGQYVSADNGQNIYWWSPAKRRATKLSEKEAAVVRGGRSLASNKIAKVGQGWLNQAIALG